MIHGWTQLFISLFLMVCSGPCHLECRSWFPVAFLSALTLLANTVGSCVSRSRMIQAIWTTASKILVVKKTQRQLMYWVMYQPMIGAIAGERKGIKLYFAVAKPRSPASKQSLRTPPPIWILLALIRLSGEQYYNLLLAVHCHQYPQGNETPSSATSSAQSHMRY